MGRVIFIAEAGVNHNGDFALAKKLVDAAADAGADVVKFQTFKAENLVTKSAQMATYQIENTQKEESQFAMLKRLELAEAEFVELKKYCESKNIKFLSTGFDLDSLKFLKTLNIGWWKIPSGEITNLPYLKYVGSLGENVILSTGMADMGEIEQAVQVLVKSGTNKEKIFVLQCTTDYPAKLEDINLNAMKTISDRIGVKVGYSDHTLGIEVSIAAVAMGAQIIEKHFTLDKNLPGPDHKASLDVNELKTLVSNIRNIEKALGSSEKKPSVRETQIKSVARKSLVAKKDIKAGEKFSLENLTVKRPGTGISPMKFDELIGSVATRDFKEDELIEV